MAYETAVVATLTAVATMRTSSPTPEPTLTPTPTATMEMSTAVAATLTAIAGKPTGARVYATALGVTQFRVQDGRYHRWSEDFKRIHFGLAGATSVQVTIKWPSGLVQTFSNVAADRVYQATEGAATLK